VRTGST